MPESTNEELRQVCQRIISAETRQYDPHRIARGLLSRLDREQESDRRLLTSAAIINAAIRIVRESAPGNETHLEYWAEQTKANMAFLNHAPLPDDGPYTDKLAESDRRLKVAREAIEQARNDFDTIAYAHSIKADFQTQATLRENWQHTFDHAWNSRARCEDALAEIAPAAPEGDWRREGRGAQLMRSRWTRDELEAMKRQFSAELDKLDAEYPEARPLPPLTEAEAIDLIQALINQTTNPYSAAQ